MTIEYQSKKTGPWDTALKQLHEWDPAWAEKCVKVTTNPWRSVVLDRKSIELISLAINAKCTNLSAKTSR